MARRITPIAVDQPVAPAHALGVELPLDVGPAPDQGDVKAVHPTLGAGRRVWADIQDSWQLKFKHVLRQQGLDYSTWKHEQDEQYAVHYRSLYGEELDTGKRKPDLITGMIRRVQGMLQPDDSNEGSSGDDEEDDSEEEGEGDDEEAGDDGSSDDADDGVPGDEIDLDKEAEAEGRKKPKRQRFERYEDDFIDDSEIEKVKGGPKVKTKYSGFYINKGNLEVVEEPVKQQRRRAPKPPADPAAAAAGASGPPAKRRKQQEPQQKQKEGSQQPLQQQQGDLQEGGSKKRKKAKAGEAAAGGLAAVSEKQAAAAEGSEPEAAGGKKKRARSESAGAGAAAADGPTAVPAKKARKASPAASDAAAAPPPPAPQAPAAAGIARSALQAAMAAAAAKKSAAAGGARGSSPSTALPPAGPSGAKKDAVVAPAVTDVAAAGGAGGGGAQAVPEQQQQQPRSRRITPAPMEAAGVSGGGSAAAAASAAAMSAVFPGGSQPYQPDGAAAGTTAPGAAGAGAAAGGAEDAEGSADAAEAAAPAGLPDEIVEAVMVLQKAVQENEAAVSGPAASTATRNKVLGGPLSTLGLAFARLPEAQQQQHQAQLLALVGPQLPHLNDKALRKKLLQEPRDKLAHAQEYRDKLLEALGGIRGAAAAGGAGGVEGTASDDDFQPAWSHAAEDSLVTAWNAAKAAGGQQAVNELALEVCTALGNTAVQAQPDRAVNELQQVIQKAKRRQKAAKEESKAIAAATAAAAAQLASADGTAATPAAAAAAAVQPAAAARTPSRQLSPAPGAGDATAVAAPAVPPAAAPAAPAAAGGAPAGTPAAKVQRRGSPDSDTISDDGGAEPDGAAGRDAAGSGAGEASTQAIEAGTQAPKMEFSQWSAPSPRLQGCIAAAKEAGASEEWLQEAYQSIRKGSTHGHQAFRVLCYAGPAGVHPASFKALSDKHDLGLQLDGSSKGKAHLKQALGGKALSSIVDITQADPHKRALLGFPGVVPKPVKPSRAATPGPAGQAEGQGGSGGGAAAE